MSDMRTLQPSGAMETQLTASRRRVAAHRNGVNADLAHRSGQLSAKRTLNYSGPLGTGDGLPGEGAALTWPAGPASGRSVAHALVLDHHLRLAREEGHGGGAGTRREPVRYLGRSPGIRAEASRGCSSMVEPQPSKLVMRVRFPSSALIQKARSEAVSGTWPLAFSRPARAVVPLACH